MECVGVLRDGFGDLIMAFLSYHCCMWYLPCLANIGTSLQNTIVTGGLQCSCSLGVVLGVVILILISNAITELLVLLLGTLMGIMTVFRRHCSSLAQQDHRNVLPRSSCPDHFTRGI